MIAQSLVRIQHPRLMAVINFTNTEPRTQTSVQKYIELTARYRRPSTLYSRNTPQRFLERPSRMLSRVRQSMHRHFWHAFSSPNVLMCVRWYDNDGVQKVFEYSLYIYQRCPPHC